MPLLLAGLAFDGGGAFLAVRSERQITELAARYEQDPRALLAEEVPRMAKVNANWARVKVTWTSRHPRRSRADPRTQRGILAS